MRKTSQIHQAINIAQRHNPFWRTTDSFDTFMNRIEQVTERNGGLACFLSIEEVSFIFDTPVATLNTMCRNKQIPSILMGGRYKLPIAQMIEWVERQIEEPDMMHRWTPVSIDGWYRPCLDTFVRKDDKWLWVHDLSREADFTMLFVYKKQCEERCDELNKVTK